MNVSCVSEGPVAQEAHVAQVAQEAHVPQRLYGERSGDGGV